MSAEIEASVNELLQREQIDYTATLMMKYAKSDDTANPWLHDLWRVTFTRVGKGKPTTFSLDFRTGTGHRRKFDTPVIPKAASVLSSVVMEDTRGESFDSWCANFGFDNDSIKALDIYRMCQRQTDEAKKFFGEYVYHTLAVLTENY